MLWDAVLDALAVLLPVDCAGCGRPDRGLCDECRAALAPEVTSRPVAADLRVWSGLDYEGVARQVLLAVKRDGRVAVTLGLAAALAASVAAVGAPQARVVAIPGTRAAFRRRGFDTVQLIARRAGLTPWNVFAPARPHRAQKLLGADEREANLRGAFRLRRAVAGHRILLVDDVVTSGATLREAARTLRAAGAEVVGAAVVASTARRYGTLRESTVTDP